MPSQTDQQRLSSSAGSSTTKHHHVHHHHHSNKGSARRSHSHKSDASAGETDYSMYSMYSLYTADNSSEYPVSTERKTRDEYDSNVDDEVSYTTAETEDSYGPGRPRERQDSHFEEAERRAREALETIAMKDDDVMVRLPELLKTLRLYRRECSRRSMYREAHLVQQVLRNLRLEEEARHIRGLTDHQMTERFKMEEAHRQEFRAFHTKWNSRIDHFEEAQLEEEIGVLEKQNDELMAFHEEMRSYNPRVIRFSRSLVHSRLKQHTLARQRRYAQALEEKENGDEIEQSDIEKFESTKDTLYGRKERALRRSHQQILSAMRNRVQSRRNFLERERKKELDEMLQRYINARRELETHQNIIRSKTGTILLKHACNTNTDTSGSAAIMISAESGAFGTTIQSQYQKKNQELEGGGSAQRRIEYDDLGEEGEEEEDYGEEEDDEYYRNGEDVDVDDGDDQQQQQEEEGEEEYAEEEEEDAASG